MKSLSLNKKRIIILLTPFTYVIFVAIGVLLETFDTGNYALSMLGYIFVVFGFFISFGAYYIFMFNSWVCPHCKKHLSNIIALLFVGWFWILVTSPKECDHCGKPIDYSKSYPKSKKDKLPEWAQQLEDKKNNHEKSDYFRH